MDKFTSKLKTTFKKKVEQGRDMEMLREQFLMEMMKHDMSTRADDLTEIPRPQDIYGYLIDDERIENKALCFERHKNMLRMRTQESLSVKFTPSCHLILENTADALRVSINNKTSAIQQIRYRSVVDLAEWVVRQKQQFDDYMAEWEDILCDVAKKGKTRRMTTLAVKAIVSEALRDFPHAHFDVLEQSRRVRVIVRLSTCNLGINLYAYYGSYKEKLPPQLEDLKRILEVHRHNCVKTFFTYTA